MNTPQRRRRRDGELLDAIRIAVRAELSDHGYEAVTFEGVARRAGTSKPVLYRRYSSRAEMVMDAMPIRDPGPGPDDLPGPLAQDLQVLIESLLDQVGHHVVKTFLGIISEAEPDAVAQLGTQLAGALERRLDEVLQAARARGELGTRPVSPRVLSALVCLTRGELIFARATHQPMDVPGMVTEVIIPLLQVSTAQFELHQP